MVGLPSPMHLMYKLYPPTSTMPIILPGSTNRAEVVGDGSGVGVGGSGVSVGGTAVSVGGKTIAVGGSEGSVGGAALGVATGATQADNRVSTSRI